MLRAGVGISARLRVAEAVEEAVGSALSLGGLGRVDAALVFATAAWGPALPELARTVSRRLACEALAGASVSGVFAGDQEVTGRPALAVLALEGTQARGFLADGLTARERDAAPAIDAELAGASTPGSLLVLLADSAGLDPEPLLTDLQAASQIVGLGAVEPQGGQPLVWCGERSSHAAVAGLLIASTGSLRTGVTSTCRPCSGPHRVTRVDGYWILELDGRPALDVFRAALPAALSVDLGRATRSLLVALAPARGGSLDTLAAALRVRPVVGVDVERGSFSAASLLRCGSEILLLALDDPAASGAELRKLGTQTAAGLPASFGIYLGCRGAGGPPLAGHSGTEAADLASGLPGVPLIGATGAFQLVRDPAGRASPLLTHAGVLALV